MLEGNNDCRFPGKYMVKDRTSFFAIGGTFLLLHGPKALGYLDEKTETFPIIAIINRIKRSLIGLTRKRKTPIDRLPVQPSRTKKEKSDTEKRNNIVDTSKKLL